MECSMKKFLWVPKLELCLIYSEPTQILFTKYLESLRSYEQNCKNSI